MDLCVTADYHGRAHVTGAVEHWSSHRTQCHSACQGVGALFLSLIVNILPLPSILPGFLLEWSDALPQICIGAFTLLALVMYQGPELSERLQTFWRDLRSSRASASP